MLTATTSVAEADFFMSMPPCPIRVGGAEKVTAAEPATSAGRRYSNEWNAVRSADRQLERRRGRRARDRRRDVALRDPDAASQPARLPRRALRRQRRGRSGRRDAAGIYQRVRAPEAVR